MPPETQIRIRRGNQSALPQGAQGEPLYTLDSKKFFVGNGDGTNTEMATVAEMTDAIAAAVAGLGGGGGGGSDFDPATMMEFYEDFTTVNGGAFTTVQADKNWFGSGGGSFSPCQTMPGAIGAIAIQANAGSQIGLFTHDFFSGNELIELADRTFDYKCRFQFDSVDDGIAYAIGFQDAASPLFQGHMIALEFNIGSSPNLLFQTVDGSGANIQDSGITADTNPHTLRIRSINAGEIRFSIDGGAETIITTHVPTTNMNATMAVGTYNTTTKPHQVNVDYVWFKATGLSR